MARKRKKKEVQVKITPATEEQKKKVAPGEVRKIGTGAGRAKKISEKVERAISKREPITSKTPRAVREHLEQTTPRRDVTQVGGEIVETRIVSKKEALKTAREAGGVSPAAQERQKTKGFQNVIDVFGIALNPFSKDKIVSNTDNRIFNTGAEYVANNPFTSALMLQGVGGLVKSGAKALAGKAGAKGATRFEPFDVRHFGRREAERAGRIITRVGPTGIARDLGFNAGYAMNTKTAKLSAGMLGQVLAQFKKPVFVLGAIGGIIGTYPWAEWAGGEASEIMGFTMQKAIKSEDPDVIRETQRIQNEIMDPAVWEQIGRTIPLANIAVGFNKKVKALRQQMDVNNNAVDTFFAKQEEEAEKPTPEESQQQIDAREEEIRRGR